MNTVISQNYALSAINANLSKLIKIVNDHETKMKSLEQKIAYVDAVIDRVKAPPVPTPPPQVSEERIRAIVDASLKSLLAAQPSPIPPVQESVSAPTSEQDIVDNLDVSALNDTLMATNAIQDDDIVIEEKKTKATRGGRRPTTRKA